MKKTGVTRVWQVIYPIGIYYVVSSIAYFCLGILLGTETQTYMLRQMICGAVTIPFILPFYRQDRQMERVVYGKIRHYTAMQTTRNIVVAVVTTAMLGIALNNLLAMTPLIELSTGFHEANTSFFAGIVLYELLGSCLVIPIAEELLYRGVVYQRLEMMAGSWPAILLSALIFGLMHANVVQFIYAGMLGILLAFLANRTKRLYIPILGHISANLFAVIRQETGWLAFAYEPTALGISISLLLIGVAVAILILWNKYGVLAESRQN